MKTLQRRKLPERNTIIHLKVRRKNDKEAHEEGDPEAYQDDQDPEEVNQGLEEVDQDPDEVTLDIKGIDLGIVPLTRKSRKMVKLTRVNPALKKNTKNSRTEKERSVVMKLMKVFYFLEDDALMIFVLEIVA